MIPSNPARRIASSSSRLFPRALAPCAWLLALLAFASAAAFSATTSQTQPAPSAATQAATVPASPARAPTAAAPRSRNFSTDFEVLTRKSIFDKTRIRTGRDSSSYSGRNRYANSGSSKSSVPVLLGAMYQDDGPVAYVEDPSSGTIWPVAVGDPLPADAGTVVNVTLDYLDITRLNGSPLRIFIGQNILGEVPAVPAAAPDASASTNGSASPSTPSPAFAPVAPATLPSGPETTGLSLEERMKLRAKQQRGN